MSACRRSYESMQEGPDLFWGSEKASPRDIDQSCDVQGGS